MAGLSAFDFVPEGQRPGHGERRAEGRAAHSERAKEALGHHVGVGLAGKLFAGQAGDPVAGVGIGVNLAGLGEEPGFVHGADSETQSVVVVAAAHDGFVGESGGVREELMGRERGDFWMQAGDAIADGLVELELALVGQADEGGGREHFGGRA